MIRQNLRRLLLLAAVLLVGVACDHDDDIFLTSPDSDSSHPTAPATVRLVPDAIDYGVGAEVTTLLVIENATKVGSVAFRLRYDPAVIEYVDSEEGTFMKSDGSVTLFLASPTAGGGEIAVGLSRLGGGPGASGSGLLATFRFHSVGPGDGGFAFAAASVKSPQAQTLPAVFSIIPIQVMP